MTGLGPTPYRAVARVLRRLGFHGVRQKGSHVLYRHPDGRTTVVPNHPGEDVGVGLLRKILRDANLDAAEFLRLL